MSKNPKLSPDDQRRVLLDAATAMADHMPLASIRLTAIAKQAGLSPAAAARCFPKRDALLTALHQHFLDRLIGTIMATMPPGEARLRKSVESFQDACLSHHRLRRQLVQLEISNTAVRKAAVARRAGFRTLLALELRAMGIAQADEAARLFRALIEEVTHAETEAGRALPPLREKVWRFLDLWRPTGKA